MNSIKTLSAALTEWVMVVAKSAMPQLVVPVDSTIGRMMSFIGVNPATYNIYNELGFLLKPTMRRFIQPTLTKYLGGMTDAEVEEMALEYAEALRTQAMEKGYVNIFGIQVGANAFDGLKDILTNKFNE